jgi:hypothetical protein
VWGPAANCDAAAYIAALGSQLPPPPPGAPGPFALSVDGALRALLADAGLKPVGTEDVACPWLYPDEETALRALLSAGPAARAIEHSGETSVREAVASAIRPFVRSDGSYLLNNVFRFVAARV